MKDIIVIGGGLSGLVAAICLRKAGRNVTVIERKKYPFHRVCGEYVSNEVKGFLERMDIYPDVYKPNVISRLTLTAVNGNAATLPLRQGGFGISRYHFDHFLYKKSAELGVDFMLQTQVLNVKFKDGHFIVAPEGQPALKAEIVIGAFGKRSRLDKTLNREFLNRRSPYLGIKYHIKYDGHPEDTIALHNFKNGYCGIVKIEDDKYNLCYLSARSNLIKSKNIREMEQNILCRNPELKKIFSTAEFLFSKPEVINEISFETKHPVEQHILMCGDAAGMITPLCGNGMAMAIHAAHILSEEVKAYFNGHRSRQMLEKGYSAKWHALFSQRLRTGRQIQKLFGAEFMSNLAVNLIRKSDLLGRFLVKQTHGRPF